MQFAMQAALEHGASRMGELHGQINSILTETLALRRSRAAGLQLKHLINSTHRNAQLSPLAYAS